jgi:hypothetical protein
MDHLDRLSEDMIRQIDDFESFVDSFGICSLDSWSNGWNSIR